MLEKWLADPCRPLGLDYRQIPVEHFLIGVVATLRVEAQRDHGRERQPLIPSHPPTPSRMQISYHCNWLVVITDALSHDKVIDTLQLRRID